MQPISVSDQGRIINRSAALAGIDAAPCLGRLVLRYYHLMHLTVTRQNHWQRKRLHVRHSVQADARIDPESLERDNDRDIDALADKTSFLRKVCRT